MTPTTKPIVQAALAADPDVSAELAEMTVKMLELNPKPATLTLIHDALDGKLVATTDSKPEKILTVAQTAERLGRSRDGAQELLARMGVTGIKTGAQGKRIRGYREADVDRVVAQLYANGKEVQNG